MSQPAPISTDLRLNTTLAGLTAFKRHKVRLEWTRQDRIRIIDLESPQEQVLADLAPQEIAKAFYIPGPRGPQQSTLTFTTMAGQKFRLLINAAVISPQPGESLEQYNARVAREGMPTANWWLHRLTSFGVNAKRAGVGRILLWILTGAVLLPVVVVIVSVIIGALINVFD